MTQKHTQLPFEVVERANAEFITRACNSHYELLEALENLCHAVTKPQTKIGMRMVDKAYGKAMAVISKAKGE